MEPIFFGYQPLKNLCYRNSLASTVSRTRPASKLPKLVRLTDCQCRGAGYQPAVPPTLPGRVSQARPSARSDLAPIPSRMLTTVLTGRPGHRNSKSSSVRQLYAPVGAWTSNRMRSLWPPLPHRRRGRRLHAGMPALSAREVGSMIAGGRRKWGVENPDHAVDDETSRAIDLLKWTADRYAGEARPIIRLCRGAMPRWRRQSRTSHDALRLPAAKATGGESLPHPAGLLARAGRNAGLIWTRPVAR
jgi:hypothetical protein